MSARIETLSPETRDWLVRQSRSLAGTEPRDPDVVQVLPAQTRTASLIRNGIIAAGGLILAALALFRLTDHIIGEGAIPAVAGGLAVGLVIAVVAIARLVHIQRTPIVPMWIAVPGALVRVTWAAVTVIPVRGASNLKLHLSKGGARISFDRAGRAEGIDFGIPLLGGGTWADGQAVSKLVEKARDRSEPFDDARFVARGGPKALGRLMAIAAIVGVGGLVVGFAIAKHDTFVPREHVADDDAPAAIVDAGATPIVSVDAAVAGETASPPPAAPGGKAAKTGKSATKPTKAPAAAVVSVKVTTVNGNLPKEVVQRIVSHNAGSLRICASSSGSAHGTASVQVVIGRDGGVSSAKASGGAPAAVSGCLERAAERMMFPQPSGGIVTVAIAVTF